MFTSCQFTSGSYKLQLYEGEVGFDNDLVLNLNLYNFSLVSQQQRDQSPGVVNNNWFW